MFKVQFDLLGPVGSKQTSLPLDRVSQLIADLAKTETSKVKVRIDGWFKIDITLVARKENIDVIEKAVAEGIFLKDLLGNLKELKDETTGRRDLRELHETKKEWSAHKRRHDKRHQRQKHANNGMQPEEEQISNLKIAQRRRVDIPGHGEAQKTYVEISLPTKCDCFHEATEVNLVDIISHVTAMHRSQIKVQTRPSWRIFALFNEARPKMGEIQKLYFSGEFEKQLNSKLHEYHVLDDVPSATAKDSPGLELSVAGERDEQDSSEKEAPSLSWVLSLIIFLGMAFAIHLSLKSFIAKRSARELDLAFLPTENVEILEDENFQFE